MKTKTPQIVDEHGKPIAPQNDSIQDLNLPAGVQALIETRLNSAEDRLRESNRTELRDLANEQIKKWRYIAAISTCITIIWGLVSWFVAPEHVKRWVREAVQQKMTEPNLRQTAEEAIRAKMGSYVDEKITPLTARADAISARFEKMSADLATSQAQLMTNQMAMGRQLHVQQLAQAARGGGWKEYEELKSLGGQPSEMQGFAKLSLNEMDWYFKLERANLVSLTLVDPISRENPGYSVEEAIALLHDSNEGNRQATVNVLHDLNKKNTVQDICEALGREDNLIVITRITRALEHITGHHFDPLDREAVFAWWKQHSGDTEFQSPYRPYLRVKNILNSSLILSGAVDDALQAFAETEAKEPDALHSRCLHAVLSLRKGKIQEAENLFNQVENKDKGYRWLHFWRPILFLTQTNETAAVASLNKAMEKSPMLEGFVKNVSAYQGLLSNTNMVWPSKKQRP